MDGFKMQNYEFWCHYWRFIDVLSSKVLQKMSFIVNKIQVEENSYALSTIFVIIINGVKCFKS